MSQRAYEIFGPDFHVVGSIDVKRFPLLVRLIDKLAEELRKGIATVDTPTSEFEPMKHGG